ncbi:MAG TPA: TrmB family transcriptional regulator [Methanoculleus sp.]|nr:TrmB family transcriptional regulator [Methanoculleus sp.]
MESLTRSLTTLGLREYEARVYAALVGIGEGTARQIHAVSGVPRPRVYDIAEGLADRGFVTVRRGSPHVYIPLEPAVVVQRLKQAMDRAATDAVRDLDALSLDARAKTSPLWYVVGEWSIRRHVEALADGIRDDLSVVCMDYGTLGEFARLIAGAAEHHPVDVLLPHGRRGIPRPLGNARLLAPAEFCEFFQEHIFRRVFAGPIAVEGTEFVLEYIFIADDRVCMIIYAQNGVRNAVVITLPFITCVQKQYIRKMIAHAAVIAPL